MRLFAIFVAKIHSSHLAFTTWKLSWVANKRDNRLCRCCRKQHQEVQYLNGWFVTIFGVPSFHSTISQNTMMLSHNQYLIKHISIDFVGTSPEFIIFHFVCWLCRLVVFLNCLFFYSPRKPVSPEFNGLFDCESWPILPEKYFTVKWFLDILHFD